MLLTALALASLIQLEAADAATLPFVDGRTWGLDPSRVVFPGPGPDGRREAPYYDAQVLLRFSSNADAAARRGSWERASSSTVSCPARWIWCSSASSTGRASPSVRSPERARRRRLRGARSRRHPARHLPERSVLRPAVRQAQHGADGGHRRRGHRRPRSVGPGDRLVGVRRRDRRQRHPDRSPRPPAQPVGQHGRARWRARCGRRRQRVRRRPVRLGRVQQRRLHPDEQPRHPRGGDRGGAGEQRRRDRRRGVGQRDRVDRRLERADVDRDARLRLRPRPEGRLDRLGRRRGQHRLGELELRDRLRQLQFVHVRAVERHVQVSWASPGSSRSRRP